jgi:Family of unknown function (DUF6266)
MARFNNGINGPFVGRVGPVVGSSWKGIPYMKAKYRKRTKHISDKEKANRIKFAKAQEWLQPLLKFVREGFKGYSPTVEGFGAAKSYLLKNAIEGEAPDFRINPAKMQVSFGDLPLSNNMAVELLADGRLQFSWDTAYVDRGSNLDQVMLLAYNIEQRHANYYITGRFRIDGADDLKIPPGTGTWHLYMAFNADDRSRQSHSVYMGEVEV